MARVTPNDDLHKNTTAIGTLSSPSQASTAKLSDATINTLRGDYATSVIRWECGVGNRTYFKEDKVFGADLADGNALVSCSKNLNGPYYQGTPWYSHYGLNSYQQTANCHLTMYYYPAASGGSGIGCYINGVGQNHGAMYVRPGGFCTQDADCDDGEGSTADTCDNNSCTNTPVTSCADILALNPAAPSGSYFIDPDGAGGNPSFIAYCDMTTNGGGWTRCAVFKNRPAHSGFTYAYTKYGATNLSVGTLQTDPTGQFCSSLGTLSAVRAEVYDTPPYSQLKFSTAAIPVSGNPFSNGSMGIYSNGSDCFGMVARSSPGSTFPDNTNCALRSNEYQQGSALAVSNGTHFQLVMGWLNGGLYPQNTGIWMCWPSTHCGNESQGAVVLYAR